MGRLTEPLTGGLVTDRDPALLKPGQLQGMRNLVYRNGAAALCHARGRSQFGVVSAATTAVAGLRDIHFDNGDFYLVAMAGTKYRYAAVGATGTFADLATIASGTSLEVVHYRNRFFLMNGASADSSAIGTNVVAYLSATSAGSAIQTRSHGLLPVEAAPNVVTAAGAFSQTVTGYYEYWTTEVAKITQDGAILTLESAYSSDNGVTTVQITATGQQPLISLPTVRNTSTTHWRVYRSPKKDVGTDKKFPVGFMIAELATGASSHADTTAVASASSFPATFNSTGYYFGWASASSMISDNGVYASGTVGSTITNVQQSAYNFSLGGFTGVVKGIKVEVEGYVSSGSAPCPVTVTIGKRNANNGGRLFQTNVARFGQRPYLVDVAASKSGQFTSTNSAAPTLLSLGGSDDRWFPTNDTGLIDTDFDATFMVVLTVAKANTTVGVDFVRVTVYYGASVDSTVQFPTVVYTFGDITAQVAKNFPPPSSNTGDLFQDQLVVNDILNPSIIRYSSPGDPEYFPPTYYMDFETRENDQVKAIRVVNNRLMVGLNTSIHRVNYLPSERDSSFDRGKASEVISRFYGIVNAMCCTTITIDGEAELLAFISNKGLHTTDGFNFITRSKNQDWRLYQSLTATSTPIALLNDPENRELLFYFRCDAQLYGNETYQCLHASYAREDIDRDGNFKFSGPVHHRNFTSGNFASLESAWAVARTDGSTAIYTGYGGSGASATAAGAGAVYFETGFNIPSQSQQMRYRTRRIYAAGISAEWTLDDLYGYCGNPTDGSTNDALLSYLFIGTKTNDTGLVNLGSTKSITLQGQRLHKVSPKLVTEGLEVSANITMTAHDFQQEFIVLGSRNLGPEQAGT
jgi:hypothetical protein